MQNRAAAAPRAIGYSVAMVSLHRSNESSRGLVTNIEVESDTFNAAYVKTAVTIWSGTRDVVVARNAMRIRDRGYCRSGYRIGATQELVFNIAHEHRGLHPDSVRMIGTTIIKPFSCGIYITVGRNLEITGNHISGQTDRYDGTLPKGAISLNHAESVLSLQDNELLNSYIGVASVGSQILWARTKFRRHPAGCARRLLDNQVTVHRWRDGVSFAADTKAPPLRDGLIRE
jgi:hypothetical protein